MKLWHRVCSMLLALTLIFGLLPTVRPTVAEAKAPTGVHNNLPSTAKDIVYLSDMAWEYSINYQSGQAIRDGQWTSGDPIVLGINSSSSTKFDNTTFTKGLGVMAKGTDATTANASYTVFDLSDNNYEQSSFYAAAGLTNQSALPNGDDARNSANGVVFEVWGSYDRSGTSYSAAEYELLESSGSADNDNYVTQGYVHQFHVDVTGVRYLKLVVYAVGSISGMNAAWGGACVYNNPGYYPKANLMGLNNNTDNSTWVPDERADTIRFFNYNFGSLPSDAVYLSGTTYKDSATYTATDKVVDINIYNNATTLGNGSFWLGGEADTITCTSAVTKDGILLKNASEFLRFNCRKPSASSYQSDGWVTFDISDLDVNRFYAAIGLTGGTIKHTAYAPDTGKYGGIKVQVWGAETVDGTYTLLSESEPIILSNVGEFDVDITGVKFLKLRIQAKDTQEISQLDTFFYMPCVYKAVDVTVDGAHSALRGLSYNYTATVTGGDGTETVTWAVSGMAEGSTTTINETTGVLTVDPQETAAYVDVTASVTVDEVTTTSETFPVVVRRTPQNMYNQLPKTAKDIVYLSDMTYKYSDNYADTSFEFRGYHFVKDQAWKSGTIVLGDTKANGGTAFIKGMGVMPKGSDSSHETASHTIFDLSDNEYAQSYFYAAAGITNTTAMSSTSTTDVSRGVVFAVYGSYDKSITRYEDATFELLEKSDTLTKGMVHQFHVDVTGVRYLKLVVYAPSGIANMNCAWGGACVYNNDGYYPKTDMIGDCNSESGAYVPYADRDASLTPTMFNAVENMFNTYQFPNLPADATLLRSKSYASVYTPGIGKNAFWIGGTHVGVNGQGWQSNFDGVLIPASSTPYFKNQPVSNGVAEGYIVYNVSSLNVDTFYAIVGVTDNAFKYTGYDRATGTYGGVGFEVWGAKEDGGEFELLSASEIITKSNTGEFIVDITGVKLLKIRHYQQDPRAAQSHGAFAYASVFKALDVSASGATSVEPGATVSYTATARYNFTDYSDAVTWTVTDMAEGSTTAIDETTGVLTVDPQETATSLTVTASVAVGDKKVTDSLTVTVAENTGIRNHRPKTAKDIKYLSDMTVVDSLNNLNRSANNYDTILDGAWTSGTIKLGLADTDGGTTFAKGLGVMPNGKTLDGASYTVFDLKESGYAHDFFYSAAGITNGNAATKVPNNGVVFAVYGAYDKSVDDYNNAEFVLLESSGTVLPNQVYQFHLDITDVRYLKLVVYAPSGIGYLNSAWGGACLYNNDGYYPKTDMIGDCDQTSGAYLAYHERVPSKTPTMFNYVENMFNTYQFENLPAGATLLRAVKEEDDHCYPGLGKDAIWLGGTHVPVNGQGWKSRYDGIQLPAGSTPYFKDNPAENEGYVVYDVSDLDANTFYAIVGAVDESFKYSDYDPATGNYGGIVFQVWGDYGDGKGYQLLSTSEVITKSNTGEFIVDITGVQLLKLRHYQQDPNAAQVHGAFGYASVFSQLSVTVSGGTVVEKGATEHFTAVADNGFADCDADITWKVSGTDNAGTTIDDNGVLTVAADEMAETLTVTASVTVGEKIITDSVIVKVVESAAGKLNHRPATATDVQHLSNMTWEYSINNTGVEATRDLAFKKTNVPIVLGDLTANGGVSTTFTKGLGVQPDATMDSSHEGAMQTVFDLADNGYKQSFFYAAAGITNDAAKQSGSTIGNGVYFAVWASYDKTEENYAQAEYVLLETSDKITNGAVHQFHLDITGVRYLKLVVYAAQNSFGYMDCNWAGACVYNNPGYYPKTDMIGARTNDGGEYVEFENRVPSETPSMFNAVENMFNTYHFNNLPGGATTLAAQQQKLVDQDVHVDAEGNTTLGFGEGWLGGTHLPVTDSSGETQNETWQKDGIKFPANTAVHFNVPMIDETVGATNGYVVYDVSELGADTFYCIVGSVNPTYKYSDYIYNNIVDADGNVTAGGGDFGGMVFEVWGADALDGDYTLLSASEPILKSNTGEFLVDITGYSYLKLQIRAQDSRTNGYATGAFVYASVFNETWDVAVSGGQSVVKGGTAEITANVTRNMIPADYYTYPGDITWADTGIAEGTTVTDGILTVASNETAGTLKVTASITEGGNSYSGTHTMTVEDFLAYVDTAGYDTLDDAVANANGGTVTLKGDAAFTKAVTLTSALTLNLGDNTVSGAEYISLGAGANLTITGSGSLDGKLKLVADDAEITSDCDIALEMNGFDATVTTVDAANVTLTDSGTDKGVEGGKIYGDCNVASRVSRNGAVQYVILDGTDTDGKAYKTANAVRVKLTRVSIRPTEAGIYYTSELKFNKNVANVDGVTYGVAVSTDNKPGTDFVNETGTKYTVKSPDKNANFSKNGNSCLVSGILDSTFKDSENAQRGVINVYVNGYVKLTVDDQEIVILAENNGTVKHSMQSIMTVLDTTYKTELQNVAADTTLYEAWVGAARRVYDFYEKFEGAMRGWKLSNLIATYERDYLKSHEVIVTDIVNGRIIVTDLDSTNPLTNTIWEWTPKEDLGWTLVTEDSLKTANGGALSEVKYRSHPDYGNVVLFCDGAGYAGMIEYSSGKCLWEVQQSYSPHSIELLEDGDIVVASSGGSDSGSGYLRYYNYANKSYTKTGNDYPLNGAHGLTWDPTGEVLWAMSFPKLLAYTVSNNALTLKTGVGCDMPLDSNGERNGHDLMPDYSDSDILWLTDNSGVYRYSKSQNTLTKTEQPASMGGVKGVATFSDGLVSWVSYSDKVDPEDENAHPPVLRVYRPRRNGTYITVKLTDETSGWNKVRPFTTDYQATNNQ